VSTGYPPLTRTKLEVPERWRLPSNETAYYKQLGHSEQGRLGRREYTTQAILLCDRLGIDGTKVLERDFDAHHYRDEALGLSYLEIFNKDRYASGGYSSEEVRLIHLLDHDGPWGLPRFVEYTPQQRAEFFGEE